MFSGTVFVRQREPDPALTLPRSCWAVYDRLDGETPIGEIAHALGLSEGETFAVVRQLQQRDLIEEPMLSYPAYRERAPAERHGETDATAPGGSELDVPGVGGDGARSTTGSSGASAGGPHSDADALHLPTLWSWLEDVTDDVRSYKNTQAFVLMEASDALGDLGVNSMGDLETIERCSDPTVVAAFRTAIRNNVDERIPERCYR